MKTYGRSSVATWVFARTPREYLYLRVFSVFVIGLSLASCTGPQVKIKTDRESDRPTKTYGAANAAPTEPVTDSPQPSSVQTVEQMGISVKCTLTAASSSGPAETIRAGDHIEVRFEVTDTTTNSPITNLSPAAWIDGTNLAGAETCHDKIESFLNGSLSARAEYNLNEFYVLALNDEPSITVVDPLFSYGGSRLLAMIPLRSPGEDWVLSADARRLYVTMPLVNLVGVIDTATWELIDTIEVGVQPTRIRMQPDGRYLWVSCVDLAAGGQKGVVSVIDTTTFEAVGRLSLGDGHHDFAFSSDSQHAYVSNAQTGSVYVMDVQTLTRVATIDVGETAEGLVYSSSSDCVYVVDGVGGNVVVIDDRTLEVIKRISDEPGLSVIKVAPNERFVLVANGKTDTVHVIDASRNAIIQTADVGPEPEQIIFSLNLAYVRSKGSEIVLMIPMDRFGKGGPLSVVDFTGGHAPFGLAATPSLADGMAMVPSGLAAVVANPVDKTIYYYREGMAAPMGEFTNYGREPRAVMVVDRSLEEPTPGVYSTTVQVMRSGTFDVAFLLDSPRVVHCFDLEVATGPSEVDPDGKAPMRIETSIDEREVPVGEPVLVRLKVRDEDTGQLVTNLRDLSVLAFATNNWQSRATTTELEDGVYEATFVPPHPGIYYLFCKVPSLGLRYRDTPYSIVEATIKP